MYTEATSSYGGAPGRPLPEWRNPGEPVHQGLGLVATLAPFAISAGSSLFSNLFGDTPDHDPAARAAWARQVATTGSGICASGRATRDIPAGAHADGDPGFTKGELVRFSLPEVVEAVQYAPEGNASATRPGSRAALRRALIAPGGPSAEQYPELGPYLSDPLQLARIAVGVAHGRLDCGVGWQEEPAAVHLRVLVDNLRNRPSSPAEAVSGAVQQAAATVKPLAAGVVDKPAAVFLGLLALGAVGAMIRGRL